jgi:hypothetical protein
MKKNDIVKLIVAAAIFFAVGFAGLGIARLIAGPEIYKEIFRLVVLTVCAFVSGFLSLMAVKKAGPCLIAALVCDAAVYLIAVELSAKVLLWNLLYVFSSLIGLMIAYIVLTHKKA